MVKKKTVSAPLGGLLGLAALGAMGKFLSKMPKSAQKERGRIKIEIEWGGDEYDGDC